MNVLSPVTGTNNVSLIREFNSHRITQQYIRETSVNVDKYFENLSTVYLYQCNDTGYRFYYPFHIFGDGQFYTDLEAKNKWYYHKERWEHLLAISFINQGQNLLEIGSGDGWFLRLLRKNGIESITGIEFNPAALQKMKQDGLRVSADSIEHYAIYHPEEFDVVCCFQVLEHVVEVKSFIDASLKCLRKGGILIIAVPNNNPYLFRYDDYHTLNLPPHHAGLWNIPVFKKLPSYYPMKLVNSFTEPLAEYKPWYQAQVKHYKETNPFKAFWYSLVPSFIYKPFLKNKKNKIEGRNIMVVFEKL